MKKHNLAGLMAAASLAVMAVAGPTMAQDTNGAGRQGGGETGTASSYQREGSDDNSKWGWLGLLGLAGLAGLRRPAPTTVVRQEKEGGARAY